MNVDMNMLTPIIIALIGAGGLWQLLSLKAKQGHEALMRDRSERTEFNDTLKAQVDRLADQVSTLVSEKEDLLKSIGDLKADLAAAQATIKSLQEQMMRK
jgi:peptidoglycan hydrolase CwlO-like protein